MNRPVRPVWRPVLWVLAAAVVVATGVVVWGSSDASGAGWGVRAWWQTRQVEQAHREALAAGRQLAVNFATLDYRSVDADTERVKSGATGEFLDSYTSSLEDLRSVVVENETTSSVERAEAALVSGDRDSAQVIVGVVAPTTNTNVPDGETKTYRLKLGLREVGGTWKVERLEFVG